MKDLKFEIFKPQLPWPETELRQLVVSFKTEDDNKEHVFASPMFNPDNKLAIIQVGLLLQNLGKDIIEFYENRSTN